MEIWILFLFLVIASPVTVIFVARLRKQHSTRMRRGGVAPGAPPAEVSLGKRFLAWSKGYVGVIGTVLLIIVGICVFYFGVYTQSWSSPSPTELGGKGQASWFWLVILWAVGHALIATLAKEGAVATWLHRVWGMVMIALIVIFPLYRWATSPSTTTRTAKVEEFKLPSSDMPNAERPSFIVPAHGEIYVPTPVGKSIHWEGAVRVARLVKSHEAGCPPVEGCQVGAFLANDGSQPVTVTLSIN